MVDTSHSRQVSGKIFVISSSLGNFTMTHAHRFEGNCAMLHNFLRGLCTISERPGWPLQVVNKKWYDRATYIDAHIQDKGKDRDKI